MPQANFHRSCWWEDKTHALYVFSILSPFNRCINCTCRQNISCEIYFCTNPTHRRLSKMVGRSVENEVEIRADIKTLALLSRGSTDIYADICTVYVSNSMSFSKVCRQLRDFSAGVGSVTSAPKYCRSKSASSPRIVIKNIYSKIRRKDILLSRLRTWLAFQKHLHCAFGEIFWKWRRNDFQDMIKKYLWM